MTFHPNFASTLRNFIAAALLLTFTIGRAQNVADAPPILPPPDLTIPPVPPNTVSLRNNTQPLGSIDIPRTPWFGDKPLPTESELKVLQTARDAAEKKPEVVAATRVYAERFGTADDLVRTLMFNNPAINNPDYKEYLNQYKIQQVLHETTWNIGLGNSSDFLLPDLTPGSFGEFQMIHMSSGHISPGLPHADLLAQEERFAQSNPALKAHLPAMRASFALDDIHQAALADKDAQTALQKVRDAYKVLDDAVRIELKKDPAVQALLEKYPYLLYGRRDLGFQVASMSIMT